MKPGMKWMMFSSLKPVVTGMEMKLINRDYADTNVSAVCDFQVLMCGQKRRMTWQLKTSSRLSTRSWHKRLSRSSVV